MQLPLPEKWLHKVLLIMLMEQQTVTNPAVTPWFVCYDETLNQQCMLTQARPTMINHLTSIVVGWVWLAEHVASYMFNSPAN